MFQPIRTIWTPSPGDWIFLRRNEIHGDWDALENKHVYTDSKVQPKQIKLTIAENGHLADFCNKFNSCLKVRLQATPNLFHNDFRTYLSIFFRVKDFSSLMLREKVIQILIDMMLIARQKPYVGEKNAAVEQNAIQEYRWRDERSSSELWTCASSFFGEKFWRGDYTRLVRYHEPIKPKADQLVTPGRRAFDRLFDAAGTEQFFTHYQELLDEQHDPILASFQKMLDALENQACSTMLDNRKLVAYVGSLARRYGASLFYKTPTGELHSIRLHVVAGNQANGAGYFVIIETGGKSKPITKLALFPKLIAARDHSHAEVISAG